jgi:hypothetical protein
MAFYEGDATNPGSPLPTVGRPQEVNERFPEGGRKMMADV